MRSSTHRPSQLGCLRLFCIAVVLLAVHLPAQEKSSSPVVEGWPFDAAEAARRQTATAQATKLPVVMKIPLGGKASVALTFRLIPSGKFIIGSPPTENGHEGDERQHLETIDEPFYMAGPCGLWQRLHQGPHRLWRHVSCRIGRQRRAPGEHHDQQRS